MKNKKLLLLPAAVAAAVLLIGGIYVARAATSGEELNIVDGVLWTYSGDSRDMYVPDGVTEVADGAFAGNNTIEKLSFAPSVTKIGKSAFEGCTELKSVTIPDSVKTVEDVAFCSCPKLESVTIGSGLRNMGCGVFADCDSLSAVAISDANEYLSTRGSAIFNEERSKLIQYLAGSKADSYAVPGNCGEIERYAFYGCDNLKAVSVPGIHYLSDYAFSNCKSLNSVILQIPTNEIGIRSFSNCPELSQVVLPSSVKTIHETAFEGSPWNIYFVCEPGSAAYRFADEHFYPVSEELVYTVVINTVSDNEVSDNRASASAVSTDAAVNVIASEPVSESGSGSIRLTSEGVTLGSNPAEVDTRLLGDATVVSDRAYVYVEGLRVTDGNSQPSPTPTPLPNADSGDAVGDHAHYLDQTLESYEFRKELRSIGDFAFARTNIREAVFPEGLLSIGEGAFYHCDRLEKVVIPSSVKHVGRNAFIFTPWYIDWLNDENASDFLIVGDGVLIGYKGSEGSPKLPADVKVVADGVF